MTDSAAPKTSKAITQKPKANASVKKPAISKPIPNKPALARPKTTTANKPATVKKPVPTTTSKPTASANKPQTLITKSTVTKAPLVKSTNSSAKMAEKTAIKTNEVTPKKDTKKDDKKHKPEKVKMERDSFTMPKDEYAQLSQLKSRLIAMGHPVKKSELLRAGIKLLASMNDATLKSTMADIPVIKTGRPKK